MTVAVLLKMCFTATDMYPQWMRIEPMTLCFAVPQHTVDYQ